MRTRPHTYQRKDIALAAYRVADEVGLDCLSRDLTAMAAGCSTGTVSRYFNGAGLRAAALKIAVERRNWAMMSFLLTKKYKGVVRLPKLLRVELVRRIAK